MLAKCKTFDFKVGLKSQKKRRRWNKYIRKKEMLNFIVFQQILKEVFKIKFQTPAELYLEEKACR